MTIDRQTELAHRIEYDSGSDLSVLVVEAVATVSNATAAEVGPINDVVDPEALRELFAPMRNGRRRRGGTVSFRLDDHRIEIDGTEGEILVYRTYNESASRLDPEGESRKLRRPSNESRNTYDNAGANK